MRYFGLAPVTLFTVALTLSVLPAAGWFSSRASSNSSSRFSEPNFHAQVDDVPSDVAARCRRAQPTHWRYQVLHR